MRVSISIQGRLHVLPHQAASTSPTRSAVASGGSLQALDSPGHKSGASRCWGEGWGTAGVWKLGDSKTGLQGC